MLLTVRNLQKYFGAQLCLRDVSFQINEQERVGLIGENGAGKTTLIQCLTGEYETDAGEINFTRGAVVGYLKQSHIRNTEQTVYEAMEHVFRPVLDAMCRMKEIERALALTPNDADLLEQHSALQSVVDAAQGYQLEHQIKRVLNGMGFGEEWYQKRISTLSGGEYTRLCLARLLLQQPDLLILDEPTNHLDFAALEWLEAYLRNYSGAVLVVSHDRYFLDHVCNRIFEIEEQTLTAYKGNYSAYLPQKEAALALRQRQHDADIQQAAKLEEYIARNIARASTTKMAQSRRKQLEKMEITQAPPSVPPEMKLNFLFDTEPYQEVLTAQSLSAAPGGKLLFQDLHFRVLRGERFVLAGANGAGKSTLLKILAGVSLPDSGSVRLGAGVCMGFFEQQQQRTSGTVLSALWEKYPRMTELELRSHLARLRFRGEDVFKPCQTLSGGELARLRFAELLLERPNVMLLDEPTNHLDIYTREALTDGLANYEGALLVVTHDRYLMNALGCPILYFSSQQRVIHCENYDQLMRELLASEQTDPKKQASVSVRPAYGKEQRRKRAQLREEIRELEQTLDTLSQEIADLERLLNDPKVLRDHIRLHDICEQLEQKRLYQDSAFEIWESKLEKQEQFEQDI